MTFRQLETFLAVARAKNFTRAAEALHVSQSTLSQHVLELERELGVRLFDRLGRAVTLTEAGRLLEEQATRIAAAVAGARRTIDELKGLERGSRVIEERIRADEADLGVVGGHILGAKEQCLAAGLLDELLLIVPPRHPWTKRREVAPRELAEVPVLMREQ